MLPRAYEDLTGTERDNRAKKKIIEYEKKKRVQQMAQQGDQEFVENADLESKKRRFVDVFDVYNVALQQTYDYFNLLPGAGKKGDVVKFTGTDRVSKFYDQVAKMNLMNQQLIDLSESILRDIPVDDKFFKKIKKINERLFKVLEEYNDFFEPQLDSNNDKITTFESDGMKNVNEGDIDERIYDIIDKMDELYQKNNNLIKYLGSTPRSGQGRPKYNIDTTEYIIPSKYL